MQKIVLIVPTLARLREIVEAHSLTGCAASGMADGRVLVRVYPRHDHTRFALAEEPGVVVLPAAHDPEPIGDLHRHLGHIDAKPHHTMRHVALKLHEKHGPAFHPDV
jgi:hypothetical protein